MTDKLRIYMSSFVNSFGSWLTFLALALLIGEKYGTHQVAYTFLIQCLPTLLLSRSITRIFPPKYMYSSYVLMQIILAVNVSILIFDQSLTTIYAHLIFAAFVKSLSQPVFNTVVGLATPTQDQQIVQTRVGALQTSTLAFAPLVGGYLSLHLGFHFIFALDAASYLIGAAFLLPKLTGYHAPAAEVTSEFKLRTLLNELVQPPKGLGVKMHLALGFWFGFLILGAAVNAIEFEQFQNLSLSKTQIGYFVALWGVGSLVAIFIPAQYLKSTFLDARFTVAGYSLSIGIFTNSTSALLASFAFLAAGFLSSIAAGKIRAHLQNSVPPGRNPLPIWIFANQVTQFINILFYLAMGIMIQFQFPQGAKYLITLICIAYIVLILLRSRDLSLEN